MNRALQFLSYNNAIPIALSIILLGGTGAFAATDPAAMYSESTKVVAEDNTYIANKDLVSYTPRAEITAVTEDADNFYVAYKFSTIDVKDYVWQDIVRNDVITVSKQLLGTSRDLGLYVTDQLNQLIAHNNEYLREVQAKAKKQTTQKMVSTTYGGLVGKFLDERTETLPGYQPVVLPPAPQPENQVAAATASAGQSAPQQYSTSLQVMGNNPARIPLKTAYVDLGVYVPDPHYQAFGIKLKLDGNDVPDISLDTSVVGTHTITYTIVDDQGVAITASRQVEVYDQYAAPAATSTPDATPAPAPVPTPAATQAPVTQPQDPAPQPTDPAASSTPVVGDSAVQPTP